MPWNIQNRANDFMKLELQPLERKSWDTLCSQHNLRFTFGVLDKPSGPESEIVLIQKTGFHPQFLNFTWNADSEFVEVTLNMPPAIVRPVYEIGQLYPYNPETIRELTKKTKMAWERSFALLSQKKAKVDYDLVVLQNARRFSRLQATDILQYSPEAKPTWLSEDDYEKFKTLPFFWYEPMDYQMDCLADLTKKLSIDGMSMLEDQLKSLAIEPTWFKPNWVVSCYFPAGAIFLRTTVENQATQQGGGVEYIYIQNIHSRQISISDVIKLAD